jgi:hypothetical protein
LKYKEFPKLLQALAALVQDGIGETRNFAKEAVLNIYSYAGSDSEFDKLIFKLDQSQIRALKEVVQKAQKKKAPAPSSAPASPATKDKKPTSPVTPSKSESSIPTPKKTPKPEAKEVPKETPKKESTVSPPPSKKVDFESPAAKSRGRTNQSNSNPPPPDDIVFRPPVKGKDRNLYLSHNIATESPI